MERKGRVDRGKEEKERHIGKERNGRAVKESKEGKRRGLGGKEGMGTGRVGKEGKGRDR